MHVACSAQGYLPPLAYYCAIANGTTCSDEDIAECVSDEAGNGEVEVEWRLGRPSRR